MNLSEQNNRYDNIACSYDKTEYAIAKKYSYGPSMLNIAGNVRGKFLIDIACGSGYSTRLFVSKAPRLLLGIDASIEMIKLAREREKSDKNGILFEKGDVLDFDFSKYPKPDVITALFLLHYADSFQKLSNMCTSIYQAFPSGGRFATITSNPEFLQIKDKRYNISSYTPKPLSEGSPRFVKYWQGANKLCSFLTFCWSRDSYESALYEAGFIDIEFHKPIISEEGIALYGHDFWQGYLKNPHIIGITCVK